jgi:AraC-type DNA-binding domain-containing proteins
MMGGEGYVENGTKRVYLVPGNIYLIPLHTINDFICNSKIEKYFLHFGSEILPGYDIFQNLKDFLTHPFEANEFQKFLRKIESGSVEDIVCCKAYIMQVLSIFLKKMPDYAKIDLNSLNKYRTMFGFISENCSAKLTVKQACEHMKMNSNILGRKFKEDTGMTIKVYLENALLKLVKEKIILTDLSMKEIAYSLNFSDEYYFSHFFKKHTGITPTKYRLSYR